MPELLWAGAEVEVVHVGAYKLYLLTFVHACIA